MKQRVIVQAIIKKGDTTLLLRRLRGSPSVIGLYELPGGRMEPSEQPDDAIKRHVQNDTHLLVRSSHLVDVIASAGAEDEKVQNLLVVYAVEVEEVDQPITLGPNYNSYIWQSMSSLQHSTIRDSALLILETIEHYTTTETSSSNNVVNDVKDTTKDTHIIIFSDGGSRGNPGPSSAGFVIMNQQEAVLEQGGIYLGITTNNQAEYQGVRVGLEHAAAMGARTVEFRLDSMLVVNQMKGIYKIKNRELWPINERIRNLITRFDKVTFTHVPRAQNQLADGMVNKILDKHQLEET